MNVTKYSDNDLHYLYTWNICAYLEGFHVCLHLWDCMTKVYYYQMFDLYRSKTDIYCSISMAEIVIIIWILFFLLIHRDIVIFDYKVYRDVLTCLLNKKPLYIILFMNVLSKELQNFRKKLLRKDVSWILMALNNNNLLCFLVTIYF